MKVLSPARLEPGRLWSLWDMLILWGAEFMSLMHTLLLSEQLMRGKDGALSTDDGLFLRSAEEIARICRGLGLPVTAVTAENMLPGVTQAKQVHGAFLQIANTFMLEMKDRRFYCPMPQYLIYFNNNQLFGDKVFDCFPSANDDIFEAGACLAFERPTACVMHLMRVAEAGTHGTRESAWCG